MKLYTFHLSGNSRKVMMTLEELGLDHEKVVVDLMSRAQRSPDYLALNPNGRVPTLVDGDLVLWESSAIMLYLAEKRPQAGLIPANPAARATMYQWLVWQPGTFNPPMQELNQQLRIADESARDAALIARCRTAIAGNLAILSAGLGKKDYLAGEFSLADIVMTPHLNALVGMGFALPDNLEAYLGRLRQRPSWQTVLAYKG